MSDADGRGAVDRDVGRLEADIDKMRDVYMLGSQREAYERILAELERLRAENEALRALLGRYLDETPLGHQPHMIAHVVEAALGRERKAKAIK